MGVEMNTMTEKRVTVDFDSESYYLDGEYWESWDNYGEEMADAINKLLEDLNDENQQLKHHLELYQPNKDERSNFDLNLCCEENNKLLEENKKLKEENEQLKQRCKELRDDLIDHSALIKMLEDAKALDIEDMIWNTMEYRTQTEFDDDFADYRKYAKKRWRKYD